MSLAPGLRLGRYEVVEPLGAGGMGEVYRGLDTVLRRQVAIKVLSSTLAESPDALARFEREARAVASLSHPNIIVIHDVGFEAGTPYAVMELLKGRSLAAELSGGALPLDRAIDYASQIARGLEGAHSCGVIHRDLKPQNVFVTRERLLKILDFGLARIGSGLAADDGATTQIGQTVPGVVMGSPLYMSPEQLGDDPVDHRTDVFAFGIVLHELLTGRNPFAQSTNLRAMAAILNGQANLTMESSVPRALQDLVVSCLSTEPGRRPQSASELVRVLVAIAPGGTLSLDSGRDWSLDSARDRSLDSARDRSGPRVEATPIARTPTGPAVAVLPFADMSSAGDQQYFCEGMAEEIINALSQIEGLRVAARTSTFQLAAKAADLQEIGRRLGVTSVVEGSVRASGNLLRVTAKLINVQDGYQLWSHRYDRQAVDVFQLQDDIAASVAESLRGRLGEFAPIRPAPDADRAASGTTDVDAYRMFLKGRHFRYTRDDFVRALECFEQAVALRPSSVQARAGLAESYLLAGNCCYLPPRQAYARAREEIDTALKMSPASPEAVMVDAILQFLFHRDWTFAERRFKEATALSPQSVQSHAWYGLMLTALGRHDEAILQVERTREIDPVSPYAGSMTGLVYLHVGDVPRAIAEFDRALEIEQDYLFALTWLGVANTAAGDHTRAIDALGQCVARTNRGSYVLSFFGWALAAAGRREEARAILAECETRAVAEQATTVGMVWIAAALGEIDRACELYRRANDERQDLTLFLGFPGYDELRDDPRFAAVRVAL